MAKSRSFAARSPRKLGSRSAQDDLGFGVLGWVIADLAAIAAVVGAVLAQANVRLSHAQRAVFVAFASFFFRFADQAMKALGGHVHNVPELPTGEKVTEVPG